MNKFFIYLIPFKKLRRKKWLNIDMKKMCKVSHL